MVTIEYYDSVYCKVYCEPGIGYELLDYFTFKVPGAHFMPQVRNRYWDGKIRLFNVATGLIYTGLWKAVYKFCKDRGYECAVDADFHPDDYSDEEFDTFVKSLKLPADRVPHDYQMNGFKHIIRNRRGLILSPTASGKSLMIYMTCRWLVEHQGRLLIIVPTKSLVGQMAKDFASYGYSPKVRLITGDEDKKWKKDITEDVVVATWQSIYKQPKAWFSQFKSVVGDEAHQFKSKSLTAIMTKLDSCDYRFGATGTLDDSLTHELVLRGLFGDVERVADTADLMERGIIAQLDVRCILLNHSEDDRKAHKNDTYAKEMDFIVRHQKRNEKIAALAKNADGNMLILFQFVEKHGHVLYNMLKGKGLNVYYIDGNTSVDDREKIRALVEVRDDIIILASYGTTSTGVNMVNLKHVVFASPYKSKIKVLQSIGRGLRKGGDKMHATLWDIADDLQWKTRENYTLKHFKVRVKLYAEERFNYRIFNMEL